MENCKECGAEFEGNKRNKYCSECKKHCKFCKRPRTDNGISCNSCRTKQTTYKLSEADLIYILNKNTCDCCGKEFRNHKDKTQDHCHTTGNLRGIICQRCNWAVGMYETTEQSNIVDYLIKYI
jgi:hypothetical protein